MRRGHGPRDAREDLQPALQRNSVHTALRRAPVDEISVLGEFALEKEGRRIELHIVEPRDVIALAERLAN